MPRIVMMLDVAEHSALTALAKRERRTIKAEAAFMVRRELERFGLLQTNMPADLHPDEKTDDGGVDNENERA